MFCTRHCTENLWNLFSENYKQAGIDLGKAQHQVELGFNFCHTQGFSSRSDGITVKSRWYVKNWKKLVENHVTIPSQSQIWWSPNICYMSRPHSLTSHGKITKKSLSWSRHDLKFGGKSRHDPVTISTLVESEYMLYVTVSHLWSRKNPEWD